MIALALCVATATDCVVSHWGSWAPCSKTCGCGVQFRSRTLDTPPSPGGQDCPQMVGTRSCNERYCEEGAGGAGNATAPALCDVQPAAGTPAPTPRPFFGECHCDPRVDVATDVSCLLEHHTCHYRHDHPLAAQRVPHPTNCDGSVHHSIRVKHIKGVGRRTFRTHMHHICKIVNVGTSDCRCCDCVRERTTSEGCPCGSRAHFFGKRWRYGESPYFFSFRPRPGTTRCEVLGEMTRGGLIEAEEGDMFVEGRLDLDGEYLRFVGNWSEPSDDGCPSFLARDEGGEEGSEGGEGEGADGASDVWEQLHTRRCGPLSFHVKDAKLRGSWWYDKYPDFPYTLKWGACNHPTASRFSSACNASYASATDATPKGAVCTYIDSAKVQMESIVHLLNSSAFTDTRGNVLATISPSRFEIFMLGAMHQLDHNLLHELGDYFDRLDVNKDGFIDRHDIAANLLHEHDYEDHLADSHLPPRVDNGELAERFESCWEHNCTRRECPQCCSDNVARAGQCDSCHAQMCKAAPESRRLLWTGAR